MEKWHTIACFKRLWLKSQARVPEARPWPFHLLGASHLSYPFLVPQELSGRKGEGSEESSQRCKEPQDIIAIPGLDESSEEDRLTVARARKIERFLSQPGNAISPMQPWETGLIRAQASDTT